jgi:hypothetical protein
MVLNRLASVRISILQLGVFEVQVSLVASVYLLLDAFLGSVQATFLSSRETLLLLHNELKVVVPLDK